MLRGAVTAVTAAKQMLQMRMLCTHVTALPASFQLSHHPGLRTLLAAADCTAAASLIGRETGPESRGVVSAVQHTSGSHSGFRYRCYF